MFLFLICENPDILTAFYILKIALRIIFIIIPLLVIFRSIIPFAKLVVGGEEFNKFIPGVIKSIIAGLLVFFLPAFISYLFTSLVDGSSYIEITKCVYNSNLESINDYREALKIEDDKERQRVIDELNKSVLEKKEKESSQNQSLNEYNKKRVDKRKNEESQGSRVNSSGTPFLEKGTYTIHVGDSRTVGMCASVTGSYNGCSFDSSSYKTSGNDIFIAQGSMSYNWFINTAVPAVNNLISQNPDVKYNIVSYMGVNMLLYDIDKYIPKYNELANGAWKDHNILLVSVNPVNESIESQHGYSTKNNDIITFNNKLKNGVTASNVRFCDTYNSIINDFSTSDGLHYDSSTYKTIYNSVNSCI